MSKLEYNQKLLKMAKQARKEFEAGNYVTLDDFIKNKNAQSNPDSRSKKGVRKNS